MLLFLSHQSVATMAASAMLSIAGTGAGLGTEFISEFRQLGRVKSKFYERRRKLFRCSCMSGHNFPHKCIWRIPRKTNFIFKSRDSSLVLALGKENASENTDDLYDDLLNKFGKVVFKRNDQKPHSAEVDDDAESLSFAVEMAKVASEVKAADIKVLFVKPLVYWTRFFIIATAFSRPQIDAIGSKIRDLAEKKYGRVPTGDTKPNSWTLLDFGDVVVHIFLPPQRAFYNLEEFYANATPIELLFDNQPPFRS
ncbi:protein Iojap, chloroplastic isoform X1 [Corylus avellana]|uniref:protein Iojap, chloroplastic isoform X1 n=1 Tax=Corylus avellana TaxID=13451 RepID=UPI00286BA4F7|nr:protein Iojap, chloroplastic isoform X1 [Corylus avellana]